MTTARAREIVHRYVMCSQGLRQVPAPHLLACDQATHAVLEAYREGRADAEREAGEAESLR